MAGSFSFVWDEESDGPISLPTDAETAKNEEFSGSYKDAYDEYSVDGWMSVVPGEDILAFGSRSCSSSTGPFLNTDKGTLPAPKDTTSDYSQASDDSLFSLVESALPRDVGGHHVGIRTKTAGGDKLPNADAESFNGSSWVIPCDSASIITTDSLLNSGPYGLDILSNLSLVGDGAASPPVLTYKDVLLQAIAREEELKHGAADAELTIDIQNTRNLRRLSKLPVISEETNLMDDSHEISREADSYCRQLDNWKKRVRFLRSSQGFRQRFIRCKS